MQEMSGQNNAQSLFGITEILSDNHIRKLLDGVAPGYAFSLFFLYFLIASINPVTWMISIVLSTIIC
jgi:hypothetical protein